MNSPARNTDQLDTFETALLAELRREVAEHPAPAPAPRRPPRRRLKVVAAGAVATAAATVVAVGLTGGGPTASPAFAVTANADGSVEHRHPPARRRRRPRGRAGRPRDRRHRALRADARRPGPPGARGRGHYVNGRSRGTSPAGSTTARDRPAGAGVGARGDADRAGGPVRRAEYVLQIPAGSPLFDDRSSSTWAAPARSRSPTRRASPGSCCFFGQGPVMHGAGRGRGQVVTFRSVASQPASSSR